MNAILRAPDGSPVDAFALLPPGPAPALIDAALPRQSSVLELGCGAGRLLAPLAARGHTCVGVDQSADMLDRMPSRIEAHHASIEEVDLGRTFDAVIVASFLVNAPGRDAYLTAARRHVRRGGLVFVQRLDAELVPIAVDASSEDDGVGYAMRDVEHDGSTFRATIVFTIDGVAYDQRYEGEVLDDPAFELALDRADLDGIRYLDSQRTWALVRPAEAQA
jgi:SAM-dependent methyltransferase